MTRTITRRYELGWDEVMKRVCADLINNNFQAPSDTTGITPEITETGIVFTWEETL